MYLIKQFAHAHHSCKVQLLLNYFYIIVLLEGIKSDKLNPDNIADLAASLNRFLSQTNGCKNGHLTKATADLDSELCLMPNITEKNPMISRKL